MAAYGTYYIRGLLGATKWPRKQGLRGKQVVDVMIMDVTIDQMVDWAAGIGAGRPGLAVKLLGSLYNDRDWDAEGAPNIKHFVGIQDEEFAKKGLDLNKTAPHDLLDPYHFAPHFKGTVPYAVLDEPKVTEILETTFVGALLYGLHHYREFEKWYQHNLEKFESEKPTYEKIGLDVQELPSLDQSYIDGEDIIKLYVRESGKVLPNPHAKLLEDAKRIRKD